MEIFEFGGSSAIRLQPVALEQEGEIYLSLHDLLTPPQHLGAIPFAPPGTRPFVVLDREFPNRVIAQFRLVLDGAGFAVKGNDGNFYEIQATFTHNGTDPLDDPDACTVTYAINLDPATLEQVSESNIGAAAQWLVKLVGCPSLMLPGLVIFSNRNTYKAVTMDENDHRHVMAELDALRQQVASTIQRFEATGFSAVLKDDYVALHELEHRIMEMHRAHARAIEER